MSARRLTHALFAALLGALLAGGGYLVLSRSASRRPDAERVEWTVRTSPVRGNGLSELDDVLSTRLADCALECEIPLIRAGVAWTGSFDVPHWGVIHLEVAVDGLSASGLVRLAGSRDSGVQLRGHVTPEVRDHEPVTPLAVRLDGLGRMALDLGDSVDVQCQVEVEFPKPASLFLTRRPRRGEFTLGNRTTAFYALSSPTSARSTPGAGGAVLVVDIDGDGLFDGDLGSLERIEVLSTFRLGSASIQLVEITTPLDEVRFRRSTSAPAGVEPLQIGDSVGEWQVQSVARSGVALRTLVRRPTLVVLWGTWCGPCRREILEIVPRLVEFTRAGIDCLFVADDTDPALAAAVGQELGLQSPVWCWEEDPASKIDQTLRAAIRSLPNALLVDAGCRVRRKDALLRGLDEFLSTESK